MSNNLYQMPADLFALESYKSFMNEALLGTNRRGELSRAAEFIGSQRSFLSRVIATKLHLTRDQAFGLCDFWNFSGLSRDYFLTLVDFERSSQPEYKKFLKAQLEKLRTEQRNLNERVGRKSFDFNGFENKYFSSWCWSAIHFLTAIPKYQTIAAIEERLNLPKSLVKLILVALEENSLVRSQDGKYIFNSGEFHFSVTENLSTLNHQHWRQRAMLSSLEPNPDQVHFTNLQTMSLKDALKIRDLILESIAKISKISNPSEPEEAFAINLDFFKIP